MNERTTRLLLVEDNPGDARGIRELLAGDGRFPLGNVDCLSAALR